MSRPSSNSALTASSLRLLVGTSFKACHDSAIFFDCRYLTATVSGFLYMKYSPLSRVENFTFK